MAYHNGVAIFPECFNAEELKRRFYDIQSVTNSATNRHPEDIREQNIIRAKFKQSMINNTKINNK